jgi:site-specific DNA-methyltransferase (adenine-specific)
VNELHFGDNLRVLRNHIKDESVDLIYLDPPFNSKVNFNVLFKEGEGIASEAQAEAFKDTWTWGQSAAEAYEDVLKYGGDVSILLRSLRTWQGENGLMAYLAMMAVRLLELRRVLKPNGSIYLHCDPTGSHYLKVILDAIFGDGKFRNEVIWKRTYAHGGADRWGDIHDDILYYSASDDYTWNRVLQAHGENYVSSKYRYEDQRGRYRLVVLTGPGATKGASGQPWRGYDPTTAGRHWAVPKRAIKALEDEGVEIPTGLHAQLELLYQHDLIRFPQRGRGGGPGIPEFKFYLDAGQALQDIILDIPPINSQAAERLGYPTQKPVALLERIVRASSHEGDVVLDPFCGCGTTVAASESLNRQWLGIDITHYAVTLIERRLRKASPEAQFKVYGRPIDLSGARDLAFRDKYQFQWWAAWLLGVQTYQSKKGADRGIDGNIFFANGPYGYGRIIVSVKGGENVTPAMVNELNGVVQRESAEMGILITLAEPTRGMISAAAGAGFLQKSAHGRLPRIQIVTVADLLEGRRPHLPPLPPPKDAPRALSRVADRAQLEFLLPFAGADGLRTDDGSMIDPRFLELAAAQ